MNWSNIRLIFARELVDQMRDRRTLFTVFVMPLLLYPILGALTMQLGQFFREQPTSVWILGAENLPAEPALIDGNRIAEGLAGGRGRALIQLESDDPATTFQQFEPEGGLGGEGSTSARLLAAMRSRGADLLVVIPHPVRLEREILLDERPDMLVFHDSADDKSRIAAQRWQFVTAAWQQRLMARFLGFESGDSSAHGPALVSAVDLTPAGSMQTATWARILPLLIMIWCMTGAFYPAIDLCAGEKERGTLETLLSSPSSRSDIALGKLGAVMVFSSATAVLNLTSLGLTALLLLSGGGFSPVAGLLQGPPPVSAIGWVVLATIPASALFGALSLAAAAFARSSKEGQYYLVPLIMVTLPLMIIPMLPASRLDLGTSLIPVTGIMLALRGMIEGEWSQIAAWLGPVVIVTIACCAAAIRWVVYQFNREEILFRPSERFALGQWIAEYFRSRDTGPAPGHAIVCGLLILLLKFFSIGFVRPPVDWNGFALQTVILLLATVCVPALLMTLVLSRQPLRTLLLKGLPVRHVVGAGLLALCLHPVLAWFSGVIMRLYPSSESVHELASGLTAIIDGAPSLAMLILVLAVVPAIFEELAYRGFVLSGFRSMARPMVAVVLTSVLFAAAHGVIQQSLIAFVVGLIVGVIAIRSGSIVACIVFHSVHNSVAVLLSRWDRCGIDGLDWLVVRGAEGGFEMASFPAAVASLIGFGMLLWMLRPAWPARVQVSNNSPRPANLSMGWLESLRCVFPRRQWKA
jgi:sodium transport system permease protein